MPLHGRHRHSLRHLNTWIGALFALGSGLFLAGGVLSLAPAATARLGLDAAAVNALFFVGSIPFTTAAYLQLLQAANSGAVAVSAWFGWRPRSIGWLACALQFTGTVLFNANTFDALRLDLDWLQQDLAVWLPDLAGSALFLASGSLAFVEVAELVGSWRPGRLNWWIAAVNLLGCVAFMGSALLAFVPDPASAPGMVTASTALTALGAAAFLAGSLLMLPEVPPLPPGRRANAR